MIKELIVVSNYFILKIFAEDQHLFSEGKQPHGVVFIPASSFKV
jgi:hypothetical protein